MATGVAGELFPTLDANIELCQKDATQTELVLTGSYQPPFGRAGAVVDHLILHRVAVRTIGRFLDRVAQIVTSVQPAEAVARAPFNLGLEPDT